MKDKPLVLSGKMIEFPIKMNLTPDQEYVRCIYYAIRQGTMDEAGLLRAFRAFTKDNRDE